MGSHPSCVAAAPVRADLLKDIQKGINIAETTANSGSRPRIEADSPARPAGPLPVADHPLLRDRSCTPSSNVYSYTPYPAIGDTS